MESTDYLCTISPPSLNTLKAETVFTLYALYCAMPSTQVCTQLMSAELHLKGKKDSCLESMEAETELERPLSSSTPTPSFFSDEAIKGTDLLNTTSLLLAGQ